ncbi:MAG: NTPase KAP, partial [Rhizobiales bacterium]|nr:NTPase KAP [Hyphomicrobiales bacterium]
MIIPDNETAVDFLNCEAISKTVVAVLTANRKRAITMGIHGDWGAGKSSVLKMIEQELSADESVACLWFNGWTFQGFDDAKTVLIEAIITELMRQRTGMAKVQSLGKDLLRRVDWIKLGRRGAGLAWNVVTGLPSPDQLGSAVGMIRGAIAGLGKASGADIEAQLNEAASFLKPAEGANLPEAINDFRDRFSELLGEAKVE